MRRRQSGTNAKGDAAFLLQECVPVIITILARECTNWDGKLCRTSIGSHAFAGCTGITSLHLPAGLRSIGAGAFRLCTGITSLHLPVGLQSIGNAAFFSCTGLVEVHLPPRVVSVGRGAFAGCTRVATLRLPDALESIGEGGGASNATRGAFAGCTSLTRVLAPDALVRHELAAPAKVFVGCPVLRSGLMPLSAVRSTRHDYWHPDMHAWCTPSAKLCVLAVLVAELRVDRQAGPTALPSLAHELWLLILEFAPRHALGHPHR